MKVLILLVAFLAVSVAQNSECTSEAVDASKRCFTAFVANYSQSRFQGFVNEGENSHNMTDDKAVSKITKTCNIFNTFDSCLAPVIGGCNNIEGYQRIFNVSREVAEFILFLYPIAKSQCKEEFDTLINDARCVASLMKDHGEELQECQKNILSVIHSNPPNCT